MIRRNRILFFLILGTAILITGGTLLAERLGVYTLPSRTVARIPITVAVPPALADWAQAAARDFNSQNADTQVSIIRLNGLDAVQQFGQMPRAQLPDSWLADASFVADLARTEGAPFAEQGIAITSSDLVWGGFSSRAQLLGTMDWSALHDAAKANGWAALGGNATWGYVKLTIASPTRSTEGLAALITAAAAYHDQPHLTRPLVTDPAFLNWLHTTVDSVPNFSTLGSNPAEALATRGPSIGDVGLLAASTWFVAQDELNQWEPFITSTPRYTVRLDYPYLLQTGLPDTRMVMAERFGNYLARQASQLVDSGFTSQSTTAATLVEADTDAVLALLRWAEREQIGQ